MNDIKIGDKVRMLSNTRFAGKIGEVIPNTYAKYDLAIKLELTDEEATITTGFLQGVKWNGHFFAYRDEVEKI